MNSNRAWGHWKTLLVTAVFTMLIAGWFGQAAYAQNPAGFMGGVYAFADSNSNRSGEGSERFMLNQSGNDLSMNGGTLPGTYTGTLANAGAALAETIQPMFNSMYSDNGMWRFASTCTQANGSECLQGTFTQTFNPRYTSRPEQVSPEAAPYHMAVITFVDTNADGIYEAALLTGDTVPNTTFNFVTSSSGGSTFISIPWALAGVLGVKGSYPQVFIPLSNGKVVLDLNGDGIADPALFTSPRLAGITLAQPVPTLTEWGMIFMMLLLMVAGVMVLRRSRVHITLS
jgi:hypothetical protein